ncbi:hypothetical protein WH50_11200 [Pokkaliibacter plantistimulans]|uniref:DUF1289 domain-containing protein n=1 Tax=Pokkaliibacter plantistimulans TaxID=1635171 RepID=A0ABX5LX38_9GAMM|nr:DUF1289 domain-containing protein [Pokkaliibacter plantistimulans]PXF31242.1 hypothetical protein WH50_11200 [Pokkaliibacter plantistimulans]
MNQLDLFDVPVPNPCAGVCESDAKGFCKGCMRTRDERFSWNNYNNSEKLQIIQQCRQRYLRRVKAARAQKARLQSGIASEQQDEQLF